MHREGRGKEKKWLEYGQTMRVVAVAVAKHIIQPLIRQAQKSNVVMRFLKSILLNKEQTGLRLGFIIQNQTLQSKISFTQIGFISEVGTDYIKLDFNMNDVYVVFA